ncbi:MAG: formylglycine-generating enzyme family protein [Calothrix sp. MO_167.B42]|nr:formylglycine-generating enzyme family protein [Calothrix sp. MO_167.B42]
MTQTVIQYEQGEAQYFVENLGDGVSIDMVLIPNGTFTMGAPEDEEGSNDSERPQHQVTVPSFFMGRYPVTQEQWRAVANMQHLRVNHDLKPDPSRFKGDNLPVERVSWYDAVEFCSRLSKYTKRQYRLPSEAEWEYACRAGTKTPFHFGETITTDLANYDGTDNKYGSYGNGSKGIYRNETTPVGCFDAANAFGLSDMHGNVWEWCLDDWHDNYENAPTDGTPWLKNGDDNLSQKTGKAVLRGGSWLFTPRGCRSAYRYLDDRAMVRVSIVSLVGFRVVCAVGGSLQ